MELTALYVGYWEFPGEFLYTISVAQFGIPLEEIFFWIIGGGPLILAFHELLTEDGL